jgi:putative membrane protein insertion efficiency factor
MIKAKMTRAKMLEHAIVILIRAYQNTVGMLVPRVCRFEPTCSQYSIEALREHGLFLGLGLTAWRIVRCNPWCRGGHDPVPVNRAKKAYQRIRISASGYQGIRVSGNDMNEPNDLNELNVFYHRNLSAQGRP